MISQSYSFPVSWVNYKPCKNKEKKGKEINPDLELKWFIVKLQGTARTFFTNRGFADHFFKMTATKPKLPSKWTHAEGGIWGVVSVTSCLKFDHSALIY